MSAVRERRPGAMPPPLRLVAPTPPEDDTQATVARTLDYLLLPPAMWWAMPIGHIQLTAAQAARLSRIGQKRGLPDLMLLHAGALYGIELKREGGRLSKTRFVRNARGTLIERVGQEDVFKRLEAAGMRIAICHSADDVIDQLAAWEIPMRRAA